MNLYDDIIGHGEVIDLLEREARRPAHAYLFVGPANTGKAAVARRFAAALVCAGKDCAERAVAGLHPDVVLVEPDGRTALTVERARATIGRAALAPVEADRKAFVFEEAGLMNDEAANAMLKTLEEPTASSIFILVTGSEDDLPATIASRARTVVFGRVAHQEIGSALEARGLDGERVANAATISGGRPGLALALATRPEVAEYRRVWLSVPLRVSGRPGEAYRLSQEVAAAAEPLLDAIKERQNDEVDRLGGSGRREMSERHERELKRATISLHETGLEILASWYRDAVAAQFGAPVRNHDIPVTALSAMAPSAAMRRAERTLETIDLIQANQRPHLAFAALFADLGSEV